MKPRMMPADKMRVTNLSKCDTWKFLLLPTWILFWQLFVHIKILPENVSYVFHKQIIVSQLTIAKCCSPLAPMSSVEMLCEHEWRCDVKETSCAYTVLNHTAFVSFGQMTVLWHTWDKRDIKNKIWHEYQIGMGLIQLFLVSLVWW